MDLTINKYENSKFYNAQDWVFVSVNITIIVLYIIVIWLIFFEALTLTNVANDR